MEEDSTAEGKSPIDVFSNIKGEVNGRSKGHERRDMQNSKYDVHHYNVLSKFINTNALIDYD